MSDANDYNTVANERLSRADPYHDDLGKANAEIAMAQVCAIQAVAAAIDRLAEAVEHLQR